MGTCACITFFSFNFNHFHNYSFFFAHIAARSSCLLGVYPKDSFTKQLKLLNNF